ncbi:MATE family efflux transporter [Bittarella massiliensis]|uniref:Probable multidrug resistance protein NorM n=2 Tax=Clostridia TaxID=186801 RepID=A0AAQ1MBD3_9FIRM|nr:MATE family efflux transporter [Bittarella massiliensis (ex Durand et al. 2017)]ERI99408.1 MATE efflux family protein [Clostridium sp. ATCC 29733]MZL68770.1 MATE family efflux transporter [Bittarella massiliensis (ex Durand et al. 2017)]MZL81272.1 MATE family efflux transporter [Bittarella massiliensis (ex Durand et al. 2017)]SHF71425.1 putative efflux protein, MATE family [Bittarella massiliensis (ex Durand et al. 2017)]
MRGVEQEGEVPDERTVLKTTLNIAWPSILESFLISLVGMVDTVMVSSLGSYAIAAVGLTTQPKFIALAVFMSLNVAISAIVARRRGEGDRDSANRVLVQALIISVALTVVISVVTVIWADPIIRLCGSAPDTHDAAVGYLRIIQGGMIFNVLSMVINAAQRGCGNTKIAMRTNLVSNGVNIVLNYLLIGGNLGFPKLGVQGAAIATVAGTICACVMSFISVMHPGQFLSIQDFFSLKFDRRNLSAIVNIGSSTLAEQVFLRIGFLVYAVLVAKLGTTAFAAHQIGMNIMNISFSFGDGLSVAAIALVGRSLGENRRDMAKIYGGVCQRMGVLFSAAISVVCIALGTPIFMLFSREEEILRYGEMIMVIMAVITFMQVAQVVFSGCLRGAGDTKFTAVVSLISVTFIRPGLGYLFCYPLNMGLFGAWLGLAVDQLARFLLTYMRFHSGKWMHFKI